MSGTPELYPGLGAFSPLSTNLLTQEKAAMHIVYYGHSHEPLIVIS